MANIAIIGTGGKAWTTRARCMQLQGPTKPQVVAGVGLVLGAKLHKAGHQVTFGSRTPGRHVHSEGCRFTAKDYATAIHVRYTRIADGWWSMAGPLVLGKA